MRLFPLAQGNCPYSRSQSVLAKNSEVGGIKNPLKDRRGGWRLVEFLARGREGNSGLGFGEGLGFCVYGLGFRQRLSRLRLWRFGCGVEWMVATAVITELARAQQASQVGPS